MQPDWSNQIITIYLIGQFKPVKWYDIISLSEMMSYHFTDIIFIYGFITLISTHNVINHVSIDSPSLLETSTSLSFYWKFDPHRLQLFDTKFRVSLPHWHSAEVSIEIKPFIRLTQMFPSNCWKKRNTKKFPQQKRLTLSSSKTFPLK